MQTIVVASTNPVKVQCARSGFEKMFPQQDFQVEMLSTASGVPAQPVGDAQTLQGALNRASNARTAQPRADFWVGIEGGIDDQPEGMTAFAWVVVLSEQRIGKARSGAFFLPPGIVELVHQGVELGEADDLFFGRSNSKQGNGAVGLLTEDVIDRAAFYEPAVVMALIPFKHPELY